MITNTRESAQAIVDGTVLYCTRHPDRILAFNDPGLLRTSDRMLSGSYWKGRHSEAFHIPQIWSLALGEVAPLEYFGEEDFEGLESLWVMSKEDLHNERYDLILDLKPTLPEAPNNEELKRYEIETKRLINAIWIMKELRKVIECIGNTEGDIPNTQEEADKKSEGVVRALSTAIFTSFVNSFSGLRSSGRSSWHFREGKIKQVFSAYGGVTCSATSDGVVYHVD